MFVTSNHIDTTNQDMIGPDDDSTGGDEKVRGRASGQ